MKFLRDPKLGNEHLRGPSVNALKLGAKYFYGEISEGEAAGTPILVEVHTPRRKVRKMNLELSDKLYLPEDLDVSVFIRFVNSGSGTLFPETDHGWEVMCLGPDEKNAWINSHPIDWHTLDDSAAKVTGFFWDGI